MKKIIAAVIAAGTIAGAAACSSGPTLTPDQSCRQILSQIVDKAYHHEDTSTLKSVVNTNASGCETFTTQQQEVMAIEVICSKPAAERNAVAGQIGSITPALLSFMCSLSPTQLASAVSNSQ